MLLEKAFLGAPLRAADQRHRPVGGIDHDQRLDRGIIIRELALGQPVFGKDDAVGIADPDTELFSRRLFGLLLGFGQMLGRFHDDVAGRLIFAQAEEAWVAEDPFAGEFGEGDLGDQLGLDEMRAAPVGARHLDGALSTSSGFIRSIISSISLALNPVPTLPT